MIISHRHRFIFFSNGRVGSKSIEAALAHLHEGLELDAPALGLYTRGHIPPSALRGRVPAHIWNEYTKFVFVRNPWDWVVSQYFYNFVEKPLRRLHRCDESRPTQLTEILAAKLPSLKENARLAPSDVLVLFEHLRQYRGTPEALSLFQSTYVYDRDGGPLVDFVGHFESLEYDFREIARRLGLEIALPKTNMSSHDTFQTYYLDETIQTVRDLYETDIVNFGYSWPVHAGARGKSEQS